MQVFLVFFFDCVFKVIHAISLLVVKIIQHGKGQGKLQLGLMRRQSIQAES